MSHHADLVNSRSDCSEFGGDFCWVAVERYSEENCLSYNWVRVSEPHTSDFYAAFSPLLGERELAPH